MELTKCQKHLNEVQAMTLNQLIKYKITGRLESEVRFMSKNTKQTSKRVASKASKILSDGRYSKKAKSVAGSALSQARKSNFQNK